MLRYTTSSETSSITYSRRAAFSPARHERDVSFFVSDLLEKGGHFFEDLVVTFLVPVNGVEFVDGDDDLRDAERADEQAVFPSLAAGLVTGLELAASRVYNHNRRVGLGST